MSTASQPKPQAAARPPVVRIQMGRSNIGGVSFLRMMPAWIVSGGMHVVLLLMFVTFSFGGSAVESTPPIAVEETVVEENNAKQDLTNPDVGINPEVPLNFNVDRIEDVSVPGAVDPSQAVGIPGAPPDAPAMNVPAPAGLGGGLGGAIETLNSGRGIAGLAPGGMGGLVAIPGGFGGRSGSTREKMVAEGGGNKQSEAAVASGLLWFARHQAADGRWSLDQYHLHTRKEKDVDGRKEFDPAAPRFNDNSTGFGVKNDIAGTAFGLLPFLAGGETHKPAPAGTKKAYDYSKVVGGGVRFLMSKQNKEGDFGGGMYAHGLATIAMCEAYGLTSDPMLKPYAQRAIDFIVKAQDPNGGGWRYAPRQGGDTSVVGWQVMALKSGQMSGLSVPTQTLKGAEKWLDSCATSDKGGYGYVGPGETPTMTAVGLLCRQYLGWSPKNPGLLAGIDRLKRVPPGASNNIYLYYYATQVMHHMGGAEWDTWNPKMRDQLIKTQDQGRDAKRPYQLGSWDPKGDSHGGQGGRIMLTALSLLTLEVYYRHLPLYRRDMGFAKEAK